MNKNAGYDKPDQALIDEAVALVKTTDVAIVCIGSNREYESEGNDRKDLTLPFAEQALVDAVTKANSNTIIVVTAGAPYDLTQIQKNNHTIVWSWFNGSEGGNALADVLIGNVNPSGKMPFTFPASLNDSPAFALNTYPGNNETAPYKEGILVGYRWFDTKKITPLYCFGYGLSYTKFDYSGLKAEKKTYQHNQNIVVYINIKNAGQYDGMETVQFYISKAQSAVQRPEKELKAFKKIMVKAGQTANAVLNIPVNDLAYYNVKNKSWIVEPGNYKISAGSSSRDIRQVASIQIVK